MFWKEDYHLKLVIKTLLRKTLKGSVPLWFLPKRQDPTGLGIYMLNFDDSDDEDCDDGATLNILFS